MCCSDFVHLTKPQITQKLNSMCIFAKVNEQKQIEKINAYNFFVLHWNNEVNNFVDSF